MSNKLAQEYNDVFADIINVLVFDGERRVHEDDLIDMDTKTEISADDKGFRTQERDVAKFWKSQNLNSLCSDLRTRQPLIFRCHFGCTAITALLIRRKSFRTGLKVRQMTSRLLPKLI